MIDKVVADTFGFIFLQDIVSVLAPGVASHDYSASSTDVSSADGVLITPVAPPAGIPQDGTDQGPLPDELSVFTLSKDTGFAMDGSGDIYTFGGTAEIVVPEPMSMGMLALGLAALGFAGRRRS